MALRPTFQQADMSAFEAQVAEVHALAEQGLEAGRNARQMVLNRDPKLTTLEQTIAAVQTAQQQLAELAQTLGAAIPAADATHVELQAADRGLRADLTAVQTTLASIQSALATEVQARLAGDTTEAATRKAADDALAVRAAALEAAVTALQALKVMVGYGTASLPPSLAAGASTNVVVTLSRDMKSSVYSIGYGLIGGASLLGNLQVVGSPSQTATTVTLQVRNAGLAALVNLSAASVQVVAARDAA